MAAVRTFVLPHYPEYPIQIALFKDVTNAAFLRSQLLEANSDFDYAFIDASMILTPTHLLSPVFLSLHLHLTTRLKTRTPHSEIIFRLHPNNNIGESYRKFGISDTTTTLIAVRLSLTPDVTRESVAKHLGDVVEGTSVDVGERGEMLGEWGDVGLVRKVYKLGDGGGAKGKKGAKGVAIGGGVDERREMESVILGIMAIKGL
ncbi:CGI-121-domain-containing protein [Melanomma pulvis-pyrius CBS 109.77]|uniref:EKC/KEOPS complex subunit CGI121 n=1 Tax=Melanomma pulvis-pyrius CBS 109.77 TaxID=1314802 RepID=A0A6A6XFM9_9PLEO|nr:CGI-121-domain-containing protein [Melanomma pulvis-pyrius CBS 109.77]